MSETTGTAPAVAPGRPVQVTYTTTKTVTVHVHDEDFLKDLGPVATRNAFGPRIGSLFTGYIERHRNEFPEIPKDSELVYVDPQADDDK